MSLRSWSGALRYGVPGLMLGLALSWGMVGGRGLLAQGPTTATRGSERQRSTTPADGQGTAGMIAFTTPMGSSGGGGQFLYLIDTRARSFAIYRVDPSANANGIVRFEAARQYGWDLQLSEYNNIGIKPSDVEMAVKSGSTTKR